ncbi:hypothetical protein MAPG_11504 [Magnaporthiopsis poae ATCC 64411]|uniref:Uncharacterized protein n=1 Tax=Magnaporthiopsis poae (strain ATCC 64411 / 73-15) TaxID=644358 RepID=A0A0C4EFG0_MAGP6|nr:hypothetical protein MAPG_11504 [Magnaporthiopsis poae ATCC 64411]
MPPIVMLASGTSRREVHRDQGRAASKAFAGAVPAAGLTLTELGLRSHGHPVNPPASHWRMDGLCACVVLNRLFTHVAGVEPPPPGAGGGQDDDESDLAFMLPAFKDACSAAQKEPHLDPALDVLAREYIADHHHRKAIHAGVLPFLGDAVTVHTCFDLALSSCGYL